MEKKKQGKNSLIYKFNSKQQKNIVNNFYSSFIDFISEYEEQNKDWIKRHLFRVTVYALKQLKYYIDDTEDTEISWENPFVMLRYPIEIDWKRTKLGSNGSYLKQILHRIDSKIKTPKDFEKAIEESFQKYRDLALFKMLTGGVVFVVEDGNTRALSPQKVSVRSKKGISKEDYNDAINDAIKEISTKEFYFPLTEIKELILKIGQLLGVAIDGKESEDYIYLRFSGLTIDLDREKAYYPIVVGLSLPSITQLLIKEDKKTQNEIMGIVWDGIYSAIEAELDELEKKGKYPSRDFSSLWINNETFAIPSSPLMFTLLAMFTGNPGRIPRKLLDKPHNERTPEEKEVADQLINSIFDKQTITSYDSRGREVEETKVVAVISNNPKVEAKAEIGTALFGDDLSYREEALAIYIKRTFGAEGLRHLLGILIGLDEAGRKGEFVWSVNKHLDRLGYKKMKVGAYPYELKQTAIEIMKIFTSLFITATNKDGKGTGKIVGKRLFYIEGFEKEYKENWVVDEKLTVKASDFWYKNSFEASDGSSQQFTKLLKGIAWENHREHALTIYLAPLLAVFWRIKPEVRKLSFKNLLEWCNIDLKKDPNHRTRIIKDIETELEYMKSKGYLGNWENETTNAPLSEADDPLSCILAFYPPDWFKEEFKLIVSKKKKYLEEKINKGKDKGNKPLTKEEFKEILGKSGLSNRKFANKIGVSPALITRYINGERTITKDISQRIRDIFLKE